MVEADIKPLREVVSRDSKFLPIFRASLAANKAVIGCDLSSLADFSSSYERRSVRCLHEMLVHLPCFCIVQSLENPSPRLGGR
ncbi:hypothetical protein ASE63_05360 [Bosea sp. Root381]|nr:hypothetical protein ASE63_05360 [Bosea sp. Root381]